MKSKGLTVFFNPRWYSPVNLERKVAADDLVAWEGQEDYQDKMQDTIRKEQINRHPWRAVERGNKRGR